MGFDRTWLDLRADADDAARNAGLRRRFVAALSEAPHILDLGSGTGATLRALAGDLPGAHWTLVDRDAALLAEAKRRHPDAACVEADLAQECEALLSRPCDAITASALFDLTSPGWIARFARTAATQGRILYAALSYDGAEDWRPAHPADAAVATAFQMHQRREKGFGLAAGPEAASLLAQALESEGYAVALAPSPWQLSRKADAALMDALATGTAAAAVEAGCDPDTARDWRLARIQAQSCRIGHLDLLALPGG